MKKTFCFMFQHASSTELKQWTEAGSRGGYMNNVKVLASSKRGQMPDDRGPQGSTKKNSPVPKLRSMTSSNFRVKVTIYS